MLDSNMVLYIQVRARQELKGKDKNFLNAAEDSLNAAFQRWKLEHGDRDAAYRTPVSGLRNVRKENKISFDEAAPWECADLKAPSPIGLALKLHDEKYLAFLEIVKNVGFPTIFALLINRHPEPESDPYLFFAYALMVELKSETSAVKFIKIIHQQRRFVLAREKQLENLTKGRVAAGKRKSERAKEYHVTWKKWAQEAWENGPLWWTAEDVLDRVCSLVEQHGHKMANDKPYARKTIRLAITGIKKVVRSQY